MLEHLEDGTVIPAGSVCIERTDQNRQGFSYHVSPPTRSALNIFVMLLIRGLFALQDMEFILEPPLNVVLLQPELDGHPPILRCIVVPD